MLFKNIEIAIFSLEVLIFDPYKVLEWIRKCSHPTSYILDLIER